ncbi:MAG: DUF1579 domain-containing protein [Phycisphaerae bacterium]|nr:DUF1579 domain-containing protein [Phycisphaerae bacterium]
MDRRLGLVVGFAALAATVAFAQNSKDAAPPARTPPAPPAARTPAAAPPARAAPAAPPADAHQLPPGMTAEDMQAFMDAGMVGPMHKHLAEAVGVWQGKTSMWMTPAAEPMKSECVSTITPMMDGRFTKTEVVGEMPGMGTFHGFGVNGFDNVSKKFQSTWFDSMGTGMMFGTGELSSDGNTMTLSFDYNCPITKKPAVMRQVERRTGKDSMTLDMYGPDPKSGKEFKSMEIVFTRKPAANAVTTGH